MKSQSELLSQISAAGQRRADTLATQRSVAHNRLMARVSAIRALAPRIARLLELGQALYDAGLPISPTNGASWEACHKCQFVTDGISHHLGFYIVPKSERQWFHPELGCPRAIGLEGGGCSGYGLEISAEGEILRGMPTRYGSAEGKMDAFLRDFPAFERDFLVYVENITNNC